MGIFKSWRAGSRPAQDSAWSQELLVLKEKLSKDLGPAGLTMAKLVNDAAHRNFMRGYYVVTKDICMYLFEKRFIFPPPTNFRSSDPKEMATFHTDVIEPLAREFLKTRFLFNPGMFTLYGKIGDDPTPRRLISFRNAFYHYQFACIMATRYQRNGKGICRDTSLTKDKGENEMLHNIPGLYLDGEGRLCLAEIIQWVEGHYKKLIDKALQGRPRNDYGEKPAKKECVMNYLAKRGLKYFQNCLRDGLDLKELREAEEYFRLSYTSAEIPFINRLKDGTKPRA